MNLLGGAVVIDRSGELQLTTSALHAVDGALNTVWTTPPNDIRQNLTLSLPAKTRIESIGLSNGVLETGGRAASAIEFEISADGVHYQPLQKVSIQKIADDQVFPTRPVEARSVRATILATLGNVQVADLPELLIRGQELEPAVRGPIAGSWKLNRYTARLGEEGSRLFGVVDMDPPMLLEGTWSGRLAKFAWVRGKQFGVGVLAVDRSGQHLNGLWWFREAIPPFIGEAWFGRRLSDDPAKQDPLVVAEHSLKNHKAAALYQFAFDTQNRLENTAGVKLFQQLLERQPALRLRIIASDVRGVSAEENQRRTEQQIASIQKALASAGLDISRISFTPAGSRDLRDPTEMPYYVLLHSRIDLEVIEE